MVNNFDAVSRFISFPNEDEFYFIQIIQRKKENPELGKNNKCIKTYFIYNFEQLNKKKQEIIDICNQFNARAYIHLSKRNRKTIALEMLSSLADRIKLNQFEKLSDLYNSCCGINKGTEKLWVVDIDNEDINNLARIYNTISHLEPFGQKILAEFKTKNGFHLITKPFNKQKFKEKYPEVDIHTNNPSILYVP